MPTRASAEWCTAAWDVPCLQSAVYAVTIAFPAGQVHQDWSPPEGVLPLLVLQTLRLLGWALTAILLAGITGLLRQQT